MRKLALFLNRSGKLVIVATCLMFAFGQLRPVFATGQGVSAPGSESVGMGSADSPLSNDFQVSGFGAGDTLLTSISVSGGTFSVVQTGGLTLEYGYWSWTNISSVSFTGNQNAVNAALDSLTYSAPAAEGSAVLSVSVQEKQAGTFFYEGNGNLYTYFPQSGISYANAKAQAAASTLDGVQGHLVTITSQGEQDFVNSKIQNATNIWIATSDSQNEGIWRIDAGPEAGTTVWTANSRLFGSVTDFTTGAYSSAGSVATNQYVNWCPGEPNNADWGRGGEDHAVTNWNGDTCWNDLSGNNVWSIGGYVVEYEAGITPDAVSTATMSISIVDMSTTTTTVQETTTTVEETTTTSTTVPETTTTTSTTTTTTTTTTVVVPPVVIPVPDEPEIGPDTTIPADPEPDQPEIDTDEPVIYEPSQGTETTDAPNPTPEPETTENTIADDEEPVIDEEITEDEAAELAADEDFINNASKEEAAAVFGAIDEGALTDEQAAAIIAVVQNAPLDVREVFEDVVDLFEGAFDNYFMIDSNITVGQRRTVIAVGAMTIAVGSTPISRGSTGINKAGGNNYAARKEDEDQEVVGEVAGDGLEWIKNIRIFKNVDGVMKMNWKAFGRKFVYGVMNMGFTLVGSLIVYLTLSGTLQQIAGVATVIAFGAAMWLHMKEPSDD